MHGKKALLTVLPLALALLLALPGCSSPAATEAMTSPPTQTATPAATQAPSPASSPEPTPSPTPEPTQSPTPEPTPSSTPEPTATPAPTMEAGAPDAIGLYLTTRAGVRERLTEYKAPWVKGRDIGVIDAFASNEKVLKGNYRTVVQDCWYTFPKAADYKIGYRLSFTLKSGEVVTLVIRSPKDAPKDPEKYFYQYIEVYLYDDLHSTGWYSHLVESKLKKGWLMTSIKLTAGKNIAEVESARLAVFVYKNENDFDPVTGEYIGSVYSEIPVIRGK